MSFLSALFLPVLLWCVGIWLARRELRLYRRSVEDGSDFFQYSRGRLTRRLTGVALVFLTGATLAALEFFPATSASGASWYLGLLFTEVLALVILPILDLVETSRSANPAKLERQNPPPRPDL